MILGALVLAAAVVFGVMFVVEKSAQSRSRKAIEGMMSLIDPNVQDFYVEFRVPYGSKAFEPRNISSDKADKYDRKALADFVSSLWYDKEKSREIYGSICEPDGNIMIYIADTVIGVDGSGTCIVACGDIRAVYGLVPEKRDALLERGGLPSIEEMEEVIEKGLAEKLEAFDPAEKDPLPK